MDHNSGSQSTENGFHSGALPQRAPTPQADEIQTLLAVQQAIASRLELSAVQQAIADEARRLTSAEMSAVFSYQDGELILSVVSGDQAGLLPLVGYRLPVEGSLTGQAVRTGQPFLMIDTALNHSGYAPLIERASARSFIITPLVSAAGPASAVVVASRQPGLLDAEDLRRLNLLAPGAAAALENARLYARAQQAGMAEERARLARTLHDAVTQTLFSASLIADVLPRLWERSPEEGRGRIAELRDLTRGALSGINSVLAELQPPGPDQPDFAALVRLLCDAFSARSHMVVRMRSEGAFALPPEVQSGLYGVTQQALSVAVAACSPGAPVQVSLLGDARGVLVRIKGRAKPGRGASEQAAGDFEILRTRAARFGGGFQAGVRPGEDFEASITWFGTQVQ